MSKKPPKGYVVDQGCHMICGKCAACRSGSGNCANPGAIGFCLLNTMLILAAPTTLAFGLWRWKR